MAREERDRGGDRIHGVVSGNVAGSVGIGKDIHQTQTGGEVNVQITEAELDELRGKFADLRTQVEQAAPAEEREKALELVDELEEGTIAEEPKPVTMRYVRDWFVEHLPKLAGVVTGVIINPIVGKLVAAAGDAVVGQFDDLLGGD